MATETSKPEDTTPEGSLQTPEGSLQTPDAITKAQKSKHAIPRKKMVCADGKTRTEALPQAAAYQIWRSSGALPGTAIINLTSNHPKVKSSVRSVYNWKALFKWTERAIEDKKVSTTEMSTYLWGGFDAESIGEVLEDVRTEKEFEENGALDVVEYSRIIRKGIRTFVEALERGDVKVNSIADMERLAKLDRFLHGVGDEVSTQINIITGIPRPKREGAEQASGDGKVVDVDLRVINKEDG